MTVLAIDYEHSLEPINELIDEVDPNYPVEERTAFFQQLVASFFGLGETSVDAVICDHVYPAFASVRLDDLQMNHDLRLQDIQHDIIAREYGERAASIVDAIEGCTMELLPSYDAMAHETIGKAESILFDKYRIYLKLPENVLHAAATCRG